MNTFRIFLFLALLGISCFIFNFAWLTPKAKQLYAQSTYLVENGLPEESASYRDEAEQISNLIIPVALVAFALIAPLNVHVISKALKKNAK
jgi:hypothetical protein